MASGAFLDVFGGNQAIGSLAGAGTVTNSSAAARTLTTGVNNTSTTFSGAIQNGGNPAATIALIKNGTATQTLSGVNTYTGATTINGGTLALSGTGSIASSSQVNVANAAGTFDISGTTSGATIRTLNGVANSNVTLGGQSLTISNGSTTYAGADYDCPCCKCRPGTQGRYKRNIGAPSHGFGGATGGARRPGIQHSQPCG